MRCQTHVRVAGTMCARAYPDNCIDVRGFDAGYVQLVTRYDLSMEWCCFCGLCEGICPTQTLDLAPSFNCSGRSRREFLYNREVMLRHFEEPNVFQNRDGRP